MKAPTRIVRLHLMHCRLRRHGLQVFRPPSKNRSTRSSWHRAHLRMSFRLAVKVLADRFERHVQLDGAELREPVGSEAARAAAASQQVDEHRLEPPEVVGQPRQVR